MRCPLTWLPIGNHLECLLWGWLLLQSLTDPTCTGALPVMQVSVWPLPQPDHPCSIFTKQHSYLMLLPTVCPSGPCLCGHCGPGHPQPCHRANIQKQPPKTEQNAHEIMQWSIKQNLVTQYELNSLQSPGPFPSFAPYWVFFQCILISKDVSKVKLQEGNSHLIPFVHKSVKASAERRLGTFTKGGCIHVSHWAGGPQLTHRHSHDESHTNLNHKKAQKNKIHFISWSMQTQ